MHRITMLMPAVVHVNACTTLSLPGAMSVGQSDGLSQDPLATARKGSDSHIAPLFKTHATPSAPPLKTTSKVTLGAFTSAREAAQLYHCVMLHVCGQGKQGCEVPLNLTTSKDYLAKCVKDRRLPFPDSFDSGMRQAVKVQYMHQTGFSAPNTQTALHAPNAPQLYALDVCSIPAPAASHAH